MEPPIDWWRFVASLAVTGLYLKLWTIGRDVADLHHIAFPFRRARAAHMPICRGCELPFNASELDDNGLCGVCRGD